MNTLYVISTNTAYGLAFRIIIAESSNEAMNMKDIYHPKSLIELGWEPNEITIHCFPTTDSIGIKAEENS